MADLEQDAVIHMIKHVAHLGFNLTLRHPVGTLQRRRERTRSLTLREPQNRSYHEEESQNARGPRGSDVRLPKGNPVSQHCNGD
jgi:hypothetical protein